MENLLRDTIYGEMIQVSNTKENPSNIQPRQVWKRPTDPGRQEGPADLKIVDERNELRLRDRICRDGNWAGKIGRGQGPRSGQKGIEGKRGGVVVGEED